jgi:ABC-type branched-subunit amino acid transport system substrate-binding protein/alpha-beta hydrolase superfamily lysophospholipase
VGRVLLVIAAGVGALALSGSALAAAPQQLTITASDGAKLACSTVVPDTPPPAGGYPGVILFHGLGGRHQDMEPLATQYLAPAGYETLECDARGHGASEGLFGLDGPRDVQDTRELFSWLSSQTGNASIGALGISLGGGAVWNAASAGVPFKAIVPVITWTNLSTALAPQGLSKSGLVNYLAGLVPTSRWDPELLAAQGSLASSTNMAAVNALAAARSPKLATIKTPTLLVQGRHDFLFDIDQALTAYKALRGPKRLYLGDLGHAPAANPPAEQATFMKEAVSWLNRYVRGVASSPKPAAIELAHDPWDGTVTPFKALPAVKTVSVTLPGSTTISGATGKVVRSARITGGLHETFGDSTVDVRYSGAQSWDRLVAVLTVAGSTTPITAGGVKLTKPEGKVTIRLMNEAARLPAGKKLTLYLSSTSLAQSSANALYLAAVQPSAQITIGRVTLNLSVLKKAVSTGSGLRHLQARRATPGITPTQVVVGATGPLTGAESQYEPVLSGAKAYFDYVNAHGGVNGRKIVYKIEDDQYDPSKTVQLTQKLVEQENVFAIFNSIGTEHALAVRSYLNDRKVPQLLVGSGAAAIGGPDHVKFPWTMGLLPSFVGEGSIYGRLIAKNQPNAKIGVLYENDEYGQELLAGLKKGLGPRAKQIVDAESYALLDTDVASQVQSLKASGADTFVIFALPKQAIQAFVSAAKLSWRPQTYVSSVSIDPIVMKIVRLSAGPTVGEGATSTAFLHDPTNPTQRKAKGVLLYRAIMKRYLPNEDPGAVAHLYGMMTAYAMVDALKHAGRNPTRDSLMRAATHMNERNPFLLDDIVLRTTPSDIYPLQTTHLVRFRRGVWTLFGKLQRTS